MTRSPLRIATTQQLERAVREAGYEAVVLPEPSPLDIHGSIEKRVADGRVHRPFLEEHKVDLVVDFNTTALTFVPEGDSNAQYNLTSASLGLPYVSCYLDPVTSTMQQVNWADHWHILEQSNWIKCMYDASSTDELFRFNIPNALNLAMGFNDDDFDTSTPEVADGPPVVAFMGHPATTWFSNPNTAQSGALLPGLMCAAARADMPDMPFHKLYYDLYSLAEPVDASDDREVRATKASRYFNDKFIYNAFLALKQRDRFVRFLRHKLGDAFELIGDHWSETYGLEHTPRIWDRRELYARIRRTPICINLMKGNLESGLNLRHFEITASGGFLLTYPTAELPDFFEVGTECDIFRDEQELLEKIDFYLHRPQRRQEIARAGQQRTLSQHRYSHRLNALVETLRQGGALPGAVATRPRDQVAGSRRAPATGEARSTTSTTDSETPK